MALNTGFDSINATSNTFSDWLVRTNELSDLMRDDVVTANTSGAETSGDAILYGSLVANTIVAADEIRGGDYSNSGNLSIGSNTAITGNLSVTGDMSLTGTLTVPNGNLTYVIDSSNFEDLIPTTSGDLLGNSSNRWDGYFTDIDASGDVIADSLVVDSLTVSNTASLPSLSFTGETSFEDIVVTGNADIQSLVVNDLVTNTAAIIGTNDTVTSNAETVIDTFDKTQSKGFKYIIHGDNNDATSAYAIEINCSHNGTNVFFTRFGEVSNNFDATLEPQVNGANIDLVATCLSADGSNTHNFNIVRIETRNG